MPLYTLLASLVAAAECPYYLCTLCIAAFAVLQRLSYQGRLVLVSWLGFLVREVVVLTTTKSSVSRTSPKRWCRLSSSTYYYCSTNYCP